MRACPRLPCATAGRLPAADGTQVLTISLGTRLKPHPLSSLDSTREVLPEYSPLRNPRP